jgi:hypothetical protein
VHHVGVEKLEGDHPHLLIVPAREHCDGAEPVLVGQLLLGDAPDQVEDGAGDQAFELAEGLLLENGLDRTSPAAVALPDDQRPHLGEQRYGLLPQLTLQVLEALVGRQGGQLTARQFSSLSILS